MGLRRRSRGLIDETNPLAESANNCRAGRMTTKGARRLFQCQGCKGQQMSEEAESGPRELEGADIAKGTDVGRVGAGQRR